jgi:ketosteroid isomerase-like protein
MLEQIEAIEAERRAAMVASDAETLDRLIGEHALYVHTNGLYETKAEFMALVRNGTYRYKEVSQPEMNIRFLGQDVAVVTGRTILLAIIPDNSLKTVDGRSIVLWHRTNNAWRMQHYQGTLFQS